MTAISERRLRLVDPTGGPAPKHALRLTPRPERLDGLRLGLLDNSKPNSDVFLRDLAAALGSRFADTVLLRKGGASHPPEPEIVDELRRRCDVVVTGVGD